jgi:hypothetical protein
MGETLIGVALQLGMLAVMCRSVGDRNGAIAFVNRPGFGGGIDPTEWWSHVRTQEASAWVRARAVCLVDDLLADDQLYCRSTGSCIRVGEQLGINHDKLRGWVKQAQIDAGARAGAPAMIGVARWSWNGRTVSCAGRMRS